MNLEIQDFEDKKTKAGKRYTRFKTSDGWMSCFDEETIAKLKECEGKTVSVEIKEQGDFKNIQKYVGESDGEAVKSAEKAPVSQKFNTATMYVSYAKDIFCKLCDMHSAKAFAAKDADVNELMRISIDRVKQAREAFE